MIVLLRRRKLGRTSCREIAAQTRSDIRVVLNERHPMPPDPEMVIRWGCTANVPVRNVLNTSNAIHEVNDKLGFRRKLNEAGLCPRTWFSFAEAGGYAGFYEGRDREGAEFPLVLRPSKHAQGRNLHVCNNHEELSRWCGLYSARAEQRVGNPDNSYYISELINKVAEYRVFIAQGRVACVAKKTPVNPEEVGWNVARGGRFDNVRWDDWPLRAVKKSIEAFNLSSLDFGGVDVMVDGDGRAYILEINSAPSLTSPYRQSCMSKVFDWVIQNGFNKDRIPVPEERGGYLKFIHPAIEGRARIN